MRKIVLTGSTGGLGRYLTEELACSFKDELICVYRNEKKYKDVILSVHNDLTGYKSSKDENWSGLTKLLDKDDIDSITLILNAFSIAPIKNIGDLTSEEIGDYIDDNLKINYRLLNAVVGLCRNRGKKLTIINLDSGAAYFALKGWANYCSGKAYINALLGVIALENPDYRIVSFDPGVMDTDMQAIIRNTDVKTFDMVDTFIGYKEEGRLNAPSSVAAKIVERYIRDWKAESVREKYS